MSGEIDAQGERVDRDAERRALGRALTEVTSALERAAPLPELDPGDWATARRAEPLMQGAWFRFRRPLRFGVGASDSDSSVRALLFVDDPAVERDGVMPGLLLTGAPHHLRGPYAYDAPDQVPGARSGSGTGELFRWLQTARRTLDEDARAGLEGPASALFGTNPVSGHAATAVAMYRLFAQDDWMAPRFPDIARPAFCEGIAITSLVVADRDSAVVFGSPLYVRASAPEAAEDETQGAGAPSRSPLKRLFRH